MSKQTVIDWQRDGLLLACGASRGNKVIFEKVSYQPVAGEENANALQEALRRGCAELGVKGDATLIVPRELIEIKTISVPRIDPDELPDVIRFQAQRQLVNMTDSWSLDYVMLPQAPGQEMQTALVGAISPANLAEMDRAAAAAGVQFTRIVFRSIEIARFAMEHANLTNERTCMIVCVSESNADILILRDKRVIQVRGTRLPTEPNLLAATLKGEIRRSLLAAAPQLGDAKLDSTLLISTSSTADILDGLVAEASGSPVSHLDPATLLPQGFSQPDELGGLSHRLAALAGAIEVERADKQNLIDFKNPKKRPAKKKNTGRFLLYGGAAAALLLTGLGWWIMTHRNLDQQIAYFRSQTTEKAPVVEWSTKKMAELNELQDFLEASPNLLDEMQFIATKIPSSEKLIFESLTFSTQPRDGTATMAIPIRVDESGSIAAFEESLADANHSVQGSNAGALPQASDGYKWRVDESITIQGRGWDVFGTKPNRVETPAEPKAPRTETPQAGSAGAPEPVAPSAVPQTPVAEVIPVAEVAPAAEGEAAASIPLTSIEEVASIGEAPVPAPAEQQSSVVDQKSAEPAVEPAQLPIDQPAGPKADAKPENE